jgi:hypothetical protein
MQAPIDWTDELVERICAEIASGRSVADIGTEDWCPCDRTIYRRMASDEKFNAAISTARSAQQESEMDKCIEMADMATQEDWQVVKMRIWARQWRASKLAPKKYGDKIAIGGAEDLPSIVTTIRIVAADEPSGS